jgi:hypothetical protein
MGQTISPFNDPQQYTRPAPASASRPGVTAGAGTAQGGGTGGC